MELPTKTGDCDAEKTRYRIKTKKVSYKLSPRVEFHWMVWPEEPPKASYIMKNVSCYARLGEITAIAGPSGAGKTTLLEILAGMIPLNIIVGQVLVNEQPMNAHSHSSRQKRRSCTVLFSGCTVGSRRPPELKSC